MRNWKAVISGFLIFCMLLIMPFSFVMAEEEAETEEPIPESYYYTIESNGIEGWPQGPAIESAAAVVMDLDTGVFLYSKNATATMYPASTTKILTTLLVLENCDLEDTITFSGIVYDLEEGSSHLGIQPGEEMLLKDAAYGIMLASANDISNGVAEYIGGSLSGFADLMNAKAEEVGCVNTHFSNPHGLYADDHYTCAQDMALIAQAAYKNAGFRKIAGTKEYTIPETNLVEEARSFLNHHKMLQKDSQRYREWCTGGKTGFTSQCLNTLVTFAEKDGRRLVSVVFRVNGADKAYAESTAILEYAFENFKNMDKQKSSKGKSIYEVMKLNYLGDAAAFQSEIWKKPAFEGFKSSVTIPQEVQNSGLIYEVSENQKNNRKKISYFYNGYPVGTASGKASAFYVPAQMIYEKDVEVQTGSVPEQNIQIESIDEVFVQAEAIVESGYQMFLTYAEENPMKVLVGGAILLVLLIIFIVILIFRCTADARIKKRRKLEAQERKIREEEIERMTTAEIEAELRAVMAQEQKKRMQEQQALAEAERAAQEAREAEEKSRETELLLEELERERQERLASENKG